MTHPFSRHVASASTCQLGGCEENLDAGELASAGEAIDDSCELPTACSAAQNRAAHPLHQAHPKPSRGAATMASAAVAQPVAARASMSAPGEAARGHHHSAPPLTADAAACRCRMARVTQLPPWVWLAFSDTLTRSPPFTPIIRMQPSAPLRPSVCRRRRGGRCGASGNCALWLWPTPRRRAQHRSGGRARCVVRGCVLLFNRLQVAAPSCGGVRRHCRRGAAHSRHALLC